ncbi:hypothetical protein MGI18_13595 [Bacillus sp. OVS6]|nr:hypothetical protein MGI18_13595 [Bacillus sp. OVS6]
MISLLNLLRNVLDEVLIPKEKLMKKIEKTTLKVRGMSCVHSQLVTAPANNRAAKDPV